MIWLLPSVVRPRRWCGEWYTVSVSPLAKPAGGENHRASYEAALAQLTTPDPTEGDNEQPVDLWGR